ncbi:hypothetical protein BDZ97DRAFT_1763624 [Flammula alnicola]|nr:hypothetical protein BDZ97DRAFT_1763624 [Flammula alnicola]
MSRGIQNEPALINKVLPVDVLGEVFMHSIACSHSSTELCMQMSSPDLFSAHARYEPLVSKITSIHHHQCHSTPEPFFLGQVCAQWRNLVLDMPQLWSHIAIIECPKERQLELLRVWLARSRQHPISILLSWHWCGTEYMKGLHQPLRSLADLLASYASRWKAVEFTCQKGDALASFCEVVGLGSLIQLESFTLNDKSSDRANNNMNDLARLFFRLPSLRKLKWAQPDFYRPKAEAHPPWSQLRSLDLSQCPETATDRLFSALLQCRLLEDLHIGQTSLIEEQNDIIPITLPALQILRVTSLAQSFVLYDKLVVPRLRVALLQNVMKYQDPGRIWNALDLMLVRSQCRLERFSFMDYTAEQNQEQLILQLSSPSFSSLVELTLATIIPVDTVVAALMHTEDSHYILPGLRTLELRGCSFVDGAISKVASSRFRRPRGSRLGRMKVRTTFNRHFHLQDVFTFGQLTREGMEVHLSHNFQPYLEF